MAQQYFSNRDSDTSQSVAGNIVQRKPNNTGLPDNLKSGIENLSGHSMDDVKVHYNSPRPAQLQAHAFAQGNQIHLASGQEKHLPHEAWHVVQQKQGRVKPTMQLKSSVPVNDDPGLEKEADVMGSKAFQMKKSLPYKGTDTSNPLTGVVQRMYGSFISESEDEQDQRLGDKPGWGTSWYQKDTDGKLIPRSSLSLSGLAATGWKKVGVNYGLPIYQSNRDHLEQNVKEASRQVTDVRENFSAIMSSQVQVRKKIRYNTTQLLKAEKKVNQYITQWVNKNLSVEKVLAGVFGTMVIGAAAIYGLSLINISQWVYVGISGASQLLGIYYLVKWIKDDLLPGIAKITLVGLNSITMIQGFLTIVYYLVNKVPIHGIIWGALPFGLLLTELISYLIRLKELKQKEILAKLESDHDEDSDEEHI